MQNRLVETCMRNAMIQSDYELSKRLGIGKAVVSGWKNGRSRPDGINTLKLAKLGGISVEQALILVTEKAPIQHPLSFTNAEDCILC